LAVLPYVQEGQQFGKPLADYSAAFRMERRMRDAWGGGIAGGSIDIQKVNIASAMVGRRFGQRR